MTVWCTGSSPDQWQVSENIGMFGIPSQSEAWKGGAQGRMGILQCHLDALVLIISHSTNPNHHSTLSPHNTIQNLVPIPT